MGATASGLAAPSRAVPCVEVRLLPGLSSEHLAAGGRLGLAEDGRSLCRQPRFIRESLNSNDSDTKISCTAF